MNKPCIYEIRVEGHLTDLWLDWFDGLVIHNDINGEAMLSGLLSDQGALFGVLAMNIVTIFRVSIFAQFLPNAEPAMPLDRAVAAVLTVAVDFKALALFSLLFGVGLAVQFERLAGNPRRMILLVRRLAVLLAIGLAHLYLIWNGDILVEYALAGFVVLPFLGGPRWLMVGAALLLLGLYVTMPLLPPIVPLPGAAGMAVLVADATRAYGTGGLFDLLAFRIREVPAIFSLHVMVFPRTVALFLVGAFTWRSGVLRRASANRRLLFGIATFGFLLGGGLSLAAAGQELFDWPSLGRARFPVERLGGGRVGLGLCGRGLRRCEPLGRAEDAGLGRAAQPHGVHQLSGAIRDLRLDLLRLWSRPIWPPRRGRDTGDRHFRVCRAGGVQRVVAAPLSFRSCRVALALVHAWSTAADAATPAVRQVAIMRATIAA